MHALLLAAGLSTRLGPLSAERPKPLLPVCGVTLLRWAVAHCRHAGITELAVNLHHLGQQIQGELGDGATLGVKVTYSAEPEILGTGGGVRQMARLMPRQTCLVQNAKIVSDVDLAAVIAFHRERGALATMVVRPDVNAARWGAIYVDETSGRVSRILDFSAPTPAQAQAFQFTGIHVLEPELVDAVPDEPPAARCIIRTAYRALLEAGAPIFGYVHRGYFYDHSTVARYLQGNLNLLEGRADPPHAPAPLRGIDPSAVVAPGARVAGPVLVGPEAVVAAGAAVGPGVVLGRGARVGPGVTLRQAVVWDGATVRRSDERVVITPRTRVLVPKVDDPAASPR